MATLADAAARIDAYLKAKGSPLAGKGQTIALKAKQYDVDPFFIVAIAGAETDFAKYGPAQSINNPFGWGPHIRFSNYDAAIEAVARGLGGNLYREAGLTTVEEIGARWAPVGASNDPTNLNSNWATNVKKFYTEIAGRPPGNVTGAFSTGDFLGTLGDIVDWNPVDALGLPNPFGFLPDPSDIAGGAKTVVTAVPDFLRILVDPESWKRAGMGVGGAVLIIISGVLIYMSAGVAPPPVKAVVRNATKAVSK